MTKPGPKKGTKLSDEHRRKLSEAAKRRWNDPEQRKKWEEVNRQAAKEPERREKIRVAALNRNPEYREKLSAAMERRWRDPAYRQQRKEMMLGNTYGKNGKGRTLSEATRAKLSAIAKKRRLSKEHRRKIGIASRKAWKEMSKDPEVVAARRLLGAKSARTTSRRYPTEAERALCNFLDGEGVDYVFQEVLLERYCVDFIIGDLIIELDEWGSKSKTERSKQRDADLEQAGYRVMHILNKQVLTDPTSIELGIGPVCRAKA